MTDRQALIKARAEIARLERETYRRYRKKRKESFVDDSSDSYDAMQFFGGVNSGMKKAKFILDEILKFQRKGD